MPRIKTERGFLRELRKARGKGWSVNPACLIRDKNGKCPIESLAMAKGCNEVAVDIGGIQVAKDFLEMADDIVRVIVRAADFRVPWLIEENYFESAIIRKRILKALDLPQD